MKNPTILSAIFHFIPLPRSKRYFFATFFLLFTYSFGNAQTSETYHFIKTQELSSCYISASQLKGKWKITLSDFFNKAKDTSYTATNIVEDEIYKIIRYQSDSKYQQEYNDFTAKKAKEPDYKNAAGYNADIEAVRNAIQDLQLAYTGSLVTGNLRINKIVSAQKITRITIPKKEWSKLNDYNKSDVLNNILKPDNKSDKKDINKKVGLSESPIRRKWGKVIYVDTLVRVYDTHTIALPEKTDTIGVYKYLDAVIVKKSAEAGVENNQENPENINPLAKSTRYLIYRKRQVLPKLCVRKLGKKKLFIEKTENDQRIEVKDVKIWFSDGFIDNIAVTAVSNTDTLQFTNAYPIAISSKKNIRKLNNNYLYASPSAYVSYGINLGKLLQYQFNVQKRQYDYSPMDTLLEADFSGNRNVAVHSLNKENSDKIFEYKIYSDFVGLDETNPNGIVQIEAQRKIKLYSRYSLQRFPFGILQYVEPSFKWNKIEKKDAYLQPTNSYTYSVDSVTQNGITTPVYNAEKKGSLSTLDLYWYQQYSAGFNLNLIQGFNSNTKLKYNIDAFIHFGQVRLRDSVPEVDTTYTPFKVVNSNQAPVESKANTIQWGFSGKIQFFPDARYGFIIGARYMSLTLENLNYVQQNVSYGNSRYTEQKFLNNGLLSVEVQVQKNFDNDKKFYVRYVYNCQVNNIKYNFGQFQVGINMFLKFNSK